jgi:hypothetical protein
LEKPKHWVKLDAEGDEEADGEALLLLLLDGEMDIDAEELEIEKRLVRLKPTVMMRPMDLRWPMVKQSLMGIKMPT